MGRRNGQKGKLGWDKDSLIRQQRKNTNNDNNTNNINDNNEYAKYAIHNTTFLTTRQLIQSQSPSSNHGNSEITNSLNSWKSLNSQIKEDSNSQNKDEPRAPVNYFLNIFCIGTRILCREKTLMVFSHIYYILKSKITDLILIIRYHISPKNFCTLGYLNSLMFEKAGKNKPNDTKTSKQQSNTYFSGLHQARTKIW